MFNPAPATVRALQQASELPKVQERLGCTRFSVGSFSEAGHVFDPELLVPLVAELSARLEPLAKDPRLGDVKRVVTLVDGTLLKALPRIAEAMWLTTRAGTRHAARRLHAHVELDKYVVPARLDLTDGRNSGNSGGKNVLRRALRWNPAGCL